MLANKALLWVQSKGSSGLEIAVLPSQHRAAHMSELAGWSISSTNSVVEQHLYISNGSLCFKIEGYRMHSNATGRDATSEGFARTRYYAGNNQMTFP